MSPSMTGDLDAPGPQLQSRGFFTTIEAECIR